MTTDISESTPDISPNNQEEYTDALTTLQTELSNLKQAFETQQKQYEDTINKLQQENTSLQRSLIRNALTPEATPPQPKTEEQIYEENIQQLADKTIRYMEMI